MSKHYYTAIVERAQDGYGVYFPDLPGCVSAGDTFEEAVANAEAALALHFEGMAEDGETLPPANMPALIERDPDVDEVARVMIGAEWDAPKQRFNIMMDPALMAAIDALAYNRSQFLADAARDRIAMMLSMAQEDIVAADEQGVAMVSLRDKFALRFYPLRPRPLRMPQTAKKPRKERKGI